MNLSRLVLAALLALLALPAGAHAEDGALVIRMQGMDCDGCNKRLATVFGGLPWLEDVHANFLEQAACGRLVGDVDEPALQAALGEGPHTVVGVERVAVCPETLRGRLPSPWEGRAEGVDVQVISHGEQVDLRAHLVEGKYTIVDFGAPWCAPCHEVAESLRAYLLDHDDVAVRAVELEGATAQDSYEQPVVGQHLANVPGIPWLVVHAPDGKVLGRSQSLDRTLKAIEKHREREARRK